MKKTTTMKELLNERLSEEDIIKLVSNYDNKFSELEKENKEKNKEIERLNNIINELDKRCNDMIKFWKTFTDEEKFKNWKEYRIYETILKWMEELKGNDKEL